MPAIAGISISLVMVLQAYSYGIQSDLLEGAPWGTLGVGTAVLVAFSAMVWVPRPCWRPGGLSNADPKEPLLDSPTRSPLDDDEFLAEAEEAPGRLLREEALERRPRRRVKGGLSHAANFRMMRRAQKITASWAAVLSANGMRLVVNGQVMLVRLEGRQLYVDSEAVPLQEIALQLDGRVLIILLTDACHAQGFRSFQIDLDDAEAAVELALTLKVLRAESDTGAGVGWLID
ncbi:unnamed protein product, partial [Symbiodinium natans]